MNTLKRLAQDPFLYGHCLLRPAVFCVKQSKEAYEKVLTIVESTLFLHRHSSLIPKLGETISLHYSKILAFKISTKTIRSELLIFKYTRFNVNNYQNEMYYLKCTQAPLPPYSWVLLRESMIVLIHAIAKVVLAILASIVAIPLGLIGISVKAVALYCRVSNQKRQLNVQCIPPSEYGTVGKVAREWQRIAFEKSKKEKSTTNLFDDSRTINKLIAQCMEQRTQCYHLFDSVHAAMDQKSDGQYQALALIKNNYCLTHRNVYKISHLATHPQNIRSRVNEHEYQRVEKAGTLLIENIARQCLSNGKDGVYAESTHSAVGFYKKLGFNPLAGIIPDEAGTVPMFLPVSKMKNAAAA